MKNQIEAQTLFTDRIKFDIRPILIRTLDSMQVAHLVNAAPYQVFGEGDFRLTGPFSKSDESLRYFPVKNFSNCPEDQLFLTCFLSLRDLAEHSIIQQCGIEERCRNRTYMLWPLA